MRIGIICDWGYSRHTQFRSYFYATETLLGTPKFVSSIADLADIEVLLIADHHFQSHKQIWQQPGFIDACNALDILVIAISDEKMLDSVFPWNYGNYRALTLFKNLHLHSIDVDDCRKLGIGLTRVAPSQRYVKSVLLTDVQKKNKMLFVGSMGGAFNCYYRRKALIEELQHIPEVDIDIFEPCVPTWEELIRLFSEYRFVLSPIGNGNFFTSRFYEILLAGSIPVHQVLDDTLEMYDIERKYDDVVYFKTAREIKPKVEAFTMANSHNRFYMEDNLRIIFKQDGLL